VEELRQQIRALGPPGAAVWLALRAFGSVVVVPIAEELAFRGFLLRRLIAADFSAVARTRSTPWALLGSSLAFAVLHPGAWLAAGSAGIAYAWAQQLRGRTADAIIAHAITNACIALAVLTRAAYWLWV
jgi:CAAX prenyl protease-like protein